VLLSLARPNVSKESIKLYLNKTPNKPSYMTEIEEINKILAPTNGAIVWQEQILNLLIAAKLTPTEAYKARKELAKDKQIDKKLLEKIRQNLEQFGSAGEELYETLAKGGYGFSKCHAVATALLALDCAWALITDENHYIKVLNEVVPKNTIVKKAENKAENTQEAKNDNKEINEYELKSIYLGNIPSGNIIEDKFRTYVLGL
jgi:DNA polymerase III alpha subunit